MRSGLLLLAGIALAGFVAIAVVLPRIASGEVKAAAAALVSGADAAKAQIGTAAGTAGKLEGSGVDVKIAARGDSSTGEMKYVVELNGVIRGWNEKNAIEIVIVPAFAGGKISWVCKGYPHDAMPQSCGGK